MSVLVDIMGVYWSLPFRQLEICVNMHCDRVDESSSILCTGRAGLEEEPDANKGRDNGRRQPCRPRAMGILTLDWRRRRGGADHGGVPDFKCQKDATVLYGQRTPRTELLARAPALGRFRWPGHRSLTIAKHNVICNLVKYAGRYWQAKVSIIATSCWLTVTIEVKLQSKSVFSWWRDNSIRDLQLPATGARCNSNPAKPEISCAPNKLLSLHDHILKTAPTTRQRFDLIQRNTAAKFACTHLKFSSKRGERDIASFPWLPVGYKFLRRALHLCRDPSFLSPMSMMARRLPAQFVCSPPLRLSHLFIIP